MPRRRRTVVGPRRAPPRPDAASRPRAAAVPSGHGGSGHGGSGHGGSGHGGSGVPARVPMRGSAMPSSRDIMRRSEDTLAQMQEGAPMEFHDSLGVAHNASHF